MTSHAATNIGVPCPHCSFVNHRSDRFCARCGQSVVGVATRPGVTSEQTFPTLQPAQASVRDPTTRYLCAAAHLNPEFADAAVGEYLVEQTRAVPPLPGLDTAAVLREAVAARYRRRMRDGILLALLVLLAVFSLFLLIVWTVIGIGVWLVDKAAGKRLRLVAAIAGTLVGIIFTIMNWTSLGLPFALILYKLGFPPSFTLGPVLSVLTVLAATVVLTADEVAVTDVTRTHFRARNFVADATTLPLGWVRTFRTLGHASYVAEIARVARAEYEAKALSGMADVIVHRHRVPFIGAGVVMRDETLALPLVPDDDAGEAPLPFTPRELHDHVSNALSALRKSASLSPGGRLGGLSIIEQVFLPAEQLLRESGTSLRPTLLPDLTRPPIGHLPLEDARRLADLPQEAARYYRCYRVESWDRDLATSSYFTAGTDLRTLYIEWTHCVLFPIDPTYRSIDRHETTGPVRRAFESAVTLPVSVPSRVVALFRRLKPVPHGQDEVEPSRYGAGHSLREHAAAPGADSFFQEADAIRYMQVVEQALFKAIGTFLERRHYSIEDVLGAAKAKISSSITIENGTFVNTAIGNGRVEQTNTDTPKRPPAKRSEQ